MNYLIRTIEQDKEFLITTYEKINMFNDKKKFKHHVTVKNKLEQKRAIGRTENYIISSFAADVDYGDRIELVVFCGYKITGGIVDSLEIGDNVEVVWFVGSAIFEDGGHKTLAKISYIKKIN